MTFKLIAIGGLGNMLGPSASHLQDSEVARYIRVLDRGTPGERRDKFRQAWRNHGAELVSDMEALIADGDFDGIVVCAGKNGDDFQIFSQLVPLLKRIAGERRYFILHLSTVSCDFVIATQAFCSAHAIQYANYPLTGGAKGAAEGTMLIMCSGDEKLYAHTETMLRCIGRPKYFDAKVEYGAAVKLINQVMLFHGLLGLSLAITLQKNIVGSSELGEVQLALFDFLNTGAAGTRQWDFPVRYGIVEQDWQHGFLLPHAVIDVLYGARLLIAQQLPEKLILPLLELALLFTHLLVENPGKELATQAVTHLLAATPKKIIDDYLAKYLSLDMDTCFNRCISALPESVRRTLMLDVVYT